MPASIETIHWGDLPDGTPVQLFTLALEDGTRVAVSDFGATLVSWHAAGRDGRFADILLGYDTPAEYASGTKSMGGLIGRWANRIANARFSLDGLAYTLDANQGTNLLHGGSSPFHKALWQAAATGDTVTFTLDSAAGAAGFPGNVIVQVRYTLADDHTLTIAYEATSDAPTPLNLTNHAYFNLAGVDHAADVLDHEVSIDADAFMAVDDTLIPTGPRDVSDTPFDFRAGARLRDRIGEDDAQLGIARGFDHCFVLHGNARTTEAPVERTVARVYEASSGRELAVSTTERGLQFYTGNYVAGTQGKQATVYAKHAGLCLEAGGFPNQINMADAETVVLRPGERYEQITRYALKIR
jgi:aldose 1-epimerase